MTSPSRPTARRPLPVASPAASVAPAHRPDPDLAAVSFAAVSFAAVSFAAVPVPVAPSPEES